MVSETEFEISVRLRAQDIRPIDLGARGGGFPIPQVWWKNYEINHNLRIPEKKIETQEWKRENMSILADFQS